MPPTPSNPAENSDPKTEAKRALGGEDRVLAEQAAEAALEKRRLEAARAMEGEVERKRREVREFQRRERELATANSASAQAAAAEQAAWQAAQTKAAAAKAQRLEAREAQARLERIDQATTQVSELQKAPVNLNPLRTLRTDMAKAVREDGVSAASIAQSEDGRRALATGEPTPPNSRWLWIIIGLVVIGGGLGGWWYWSNQSPAISTPQPAPVTPAINLIFAENTLDLALDTARTPGDVTNAINQILNNPPSGVIALTPTAGGAPISLIALGEKIKWQPPASLVNIFEPAFMLGAHQSASSTERFLILKTRLYDQAFAGMIAWEKTLADDLWPLFTKNSAAAPLITNYSDKLVRNKDARQATRPDGSVIIFYGFLDQNTIAITTNQATFSELALRYSNRQ